MSTSAVDRGLQRELKRLVGLKTVYGASMTTHEPNGFRVSGGTGALGQARALIEATLRPISYDAALEALAEMSTVTAGRADGPETEELRMAAYVDRLRPYPADAVEHACRAWSDDNKWWPTWNELRLLLEARVRQRRLMLDAVYRAEAGGRSGQLPLPAGEGGDNEPRRGMRNAGCVAGDLVARLAVAK
jgi:hypothetical protein